MVRLLPRRGKVEPRKQRAAAFDRAVAEFFMKVALDEAKKGVGRTSPNPTVGAILVKSGRIISRGFTQPPGGPHAEVVALNLAGLAARGADLYTTLEPCGHFGRTPPCSDAILASGVRRVIYASADPNPLVNGKGVAALRARQIPVTGSVLTAEADALNRPFFHFLREGRPFITLKAAISLDGKLATATGDSRWVTGEKARERVHQLRNQVDAVMVGSGTVAHDNPQLTTRVPGGRDAVRVVVDSDLSTSPRSKVYTQRSSARTVVATLESPSTARARALSARGVEVWQLPARGGKVHLGKLLARLGKAGLLHVMVEGGSELFGALLREKLADELVLFVAPKLVGKAGLSWAGELPVLKMAKALPAGPMSVEQVGEDLLLRSLL